MNYEPTPELVEILKAITDGEPSPEQKEQLTQLLAKGPEVRRFFVQYTCLHATSQWLGSELFGCPERESVSPLDSDAMASFLAETCEIEDPPTLQTSPTRVWAYWVFGAAITCSLAWLVINVGWISRTTSSHPELTQSNGGESRPIPKKQASFAGLLTSAANARWASESLKAEVGELISTGNFSLLSGQASIELFGGGVISATGPAQFTVGSDELLTVAAGNVLISILDERSRLKVETPTAEFLHIGTEFEIDVWPDGTSDLAVLDGAVEVHPRLREMAFSCGQLVRAGNGFRISADGHYRTYPENDVFPDPNVYRAAAMQFPSPAITEEGFTVRYVKVDPNENIALLELNLADRLLAGDFQISEEAVVHGVACIDFEERGDTRSSENLFAFDLPFPGDKEGIVDLDDGFAIQATAKMYVETSWIYSFLTNSDDGVRLRIDGQDVIVDDGFHQPTISIGSIPLVKGVHLIELTYFDMHRGARIELGVAPGKGRNSSEFVPLQVSPKLAD